MQKWAVWGISFFLLVATYAVYSQVLGHPFLDYDDSIYVTNNDIVRRGLTAEGWRWAWTTLYFENWHPLTWLSHMLDCQLFRPASGPASAAASAAATWHHLVNLLFHLANTLLLFHVLRRMTGATWRPALVAALFALHPLHVESVAWVAERKDVLSVFFGLLAVGAYGRYVEKPRAVWYGLLLAAFVLSLLAKSMLVTLPAVLLLLDYWPLRRFPGRAGAPGAEGAARPPTPVRRLLLEKAPLAAVSAAFCVVQPRWPSPDATAVTLEPQPARRSAGQRPDRLRRLFGGKTVWPSDLAVFYPHAGANWSWSVVLASGLLLAALSALAVALRRRRPALLVGWLWFLGTLVPVIGVVQFNWQGMADRYTYFPLIGIFLALAWCVPERWAARPRLRAALAVGAGAVLAACAVLTWLQLGVWQDEATIWRHALAVTRNSGWAHFRYGVYLYNDRRLFGEGSEYVRRGAELDPHNSLILNVLGLIRLEEGKDDEALDLLTRATDESPGCGDYRNSLGLVLAVKGRPDEAGRAFAEAVRLGTTDPAEPYINLAVVQDEQGDHAAAARNYAEGLRRNPDWPFKACVIAERLLGREDPAWRCPAEAGTFGRFREAAAAAGGRRPTGRGGGRARAPGPRRGRARRRPRPGAAAPGGGPRLRRGTPPAARTPREHFLDTGRARLE